MSAERTSEKRLVAALAAAGLVFLAVLAVWLAAPRIADDLAARAREALNGVGAATIQAESDGRDIILTGSAPDEAARIAAIDAVGAIPGVRAVIDRIDSAARSPDVTSAYHFIAEWDGARLSLSGYMPDREAREATLAQAREALKGALIADAIEIAPGPPNGAWQGVAAAGIAAMRTLGSASFTMEGAAISFTGAAHDEVAQQESARILEGLPPPYEGPVSIAVDARLAPPAPAYAFGAAWDGASVAFSGAVPSARAAETLAAAVRKAAPGKTLDDRAARRPGAADGAWTDAALVAVAGFARSGSASFEMRGRTFSAIYQAKDEGARDAIFAAFNDLPAAYAADVEIALPGSTAREKRSFGDAASPAARCQKAFADALRASPIAFASSSAEIPDDAASLIDALAEAAATCPEARLEIAGHTDASGREPANVTLSERRAGAVEAALIVKGVAADRIAARGYGSSRPVAAETDDAGKARNRRIEVTVRP